MRKERRKIKEPGAVPQSAFPASGIYILTEGCLLSGSSGIVTKTKTPNLYLLSFLPSCSLPLGAEPCLLLPTACRGTSQPPRASSSEQSNRPGSLSCPISHSLRGLQRNSPAGRSMGCCLPLCGASPHKLARGCHLRGDGAGPTISIHSRLFSAQQGREIKKQFSLSSSHFW